jgi:hypothetical protein
MRPDIEQVVRFGDVFRPWWAYDTRFLFLGWTGKNLPIGGKQWWALDLRNGTVLHADGLHRATTEGEPFWVQVEPE